MTHSQPNRRLFVLGTAMLPLIAACSKKSNDYDGTSGNFTPYQAGGETSAAATRPAPTNSPTVAAAGNPVDKPREWPGIGNSLIGDGKYVAWTVDDGASPEAIRGYAEFSKRTNTRLTFFINASYTGFKEHVSLLRPLVQSGQIQVANHTYSHPDLTTLDAEGVKEELQRNEDEIMSMFGVSSKPYFRPPYGRYNDAVLKAAGEIGFTRPVMWNGTTGDEAKTSSRVIYMRCIRYMLPQQIVLGHLNYETIIPILDKVKGLIDDRGLTAVTVRDYYGDASEEEIKAAAPSPTPTPEENTPSPEATTEAPAPTQEPTTEAPTTRYEDEAAANQQATQQATTAPAAATTTAPPARATAAPAATTAPAATATTAPAAARR
ncbi:polysaccharide deacetylase family protein [Rothia mucilaginosa]|uniref:polysaccharide deacetylase family protein n=1 Tax=Rothia mucilaginosa TaxID=43675 RepID=UPI0028EFAF65|nr:polysaccharide deacetylase family protein [Rothia mucilaginosa]